MENIMPVLWVIVAIVLLLFMTVKMKVHSMIALLLIAIFVAFMEGMDSVSLVKTITKGAGSTLGGRRSYYCPWCCFGSVNDRLRGI